jgi:gluconate kinase
MGLYLITGVSGSGKSAVCEELQNRGYRAVDGDKVGQWVNIENGSTTKDNNNTDINWLKEWTWRWPVEAINELAYEARSETILFCGVSDNMGDFWELFIKKFYLLAGNPTIETRIKSRTNNPFGKGAGQLRQILEWNRSESENCRKYGGIAVDASQPVNQVVKQILEYVGEN